MIPIGPNININLLWEKLQKTGEDFTLEAKPGNAISTSVLETVCAYANATGIGSGYILLGIEETSSNEHTYCVTGITNPDKLQNDLITQCQNRFNIAITPLITIGIIDGKTVMAVQVSELEAGDKPLYFQKLGVEKGTYIRKGSTDHKCLPHELTAILQERTSTPYDETILQNASLEDISEEAINLYRAKRKEFHPEASELHYTNEELLEAINCVERKDGKLIPTVAGLILFGTTKALRRYFPMTRFDYIRVNGREWQDSVIEKFYSVELREALFSLLPKAEAAIMGGMEREFTFPVGKLTREEKTAVPYKAIRELLLNCVMHRDYRVEEPTVVIQFTDRIEFRNPGYSLKPIERFTSPGSKNRNPSIAAVLHETDYAENKGTGITKIKKLMQASHLPEPHFDSSVDDNQFTVVLYMHQLITEEAAQWLGRFETDLSSHEALVLVHTRNAGRINNVGCRNLLGLDVAKSSYLLCSLRDKGFLKSNSKGSATYYEVAEKYLENNSDLGLLDTEGVKDGLSNKLNTPLFDESDSVGEISSNLFGADLLENNSLNGLFDSENACCSVSNNPVDVQNYENNADSTLLDDVSGCVERRKDLLCQLPDELAENIRSIGQRINAERRDELIIKVCSIIPVSGTELGILFGRTRQWADQSLKALHSRKLVTVTEDMKYISTIGKTQRLITDY